MNRLAPIEQFFANRGWKPFPFQIETWNAILEGKSGLLYVPTGSGKTYAAALGVFAKIMAEKDAAKPSTVPPLNGKKKKTAAPKTKLRALYITPLRALARDLELALNEPISQESWPIKVEARTGDTKYAAKKKQLLSPADLMLTTPESLEILISQNDAVDILKNVEVVILDEWHELLSSKRGSLLELSLSYLRTLNPELQVWALSASIGNLEEAGRAAVGRSTEPVVITSGSERKLDVECLLPERLDRFPWTGHLGFALKEPLLKELDPAVSTLIFTNTRMQCERWYQTILEMRPEMEGLIAIHHSSLSREDREKAEQGVKTGDIKWVVCTSSLDLGVDFQPVERVVQIGSPKMVARMLQRAGRSAHRPGGKSRLLFVPTNAWEILELEALKASLGAGEIEARRPLHKPIDVLIQHMMTLAVGPGLNLDEFRLALNDTYSFGDVTKEELNWCIKFLTVGGESLGNYPQYKKLVFDPEDGSYHVFNRAMAANHRMSIGTIVTRESVMITYSNRSKIGSTDESFVAKLKSGDVFQFAGKRLQFIMMKDMVAYVRASKAPTNVVPSWGGNRFPISETLSRAFREVLNKPHPGLEDLLVPLLGTQDQMSMVPGPETLLIENWQSKEGEHLFVYPFEGRLVHEGLAQLWALRFAQREPATFSFAVNDYGFEILAPSAYGFRRLFDDDFFASDALQSDISHSLHISEMSQRQFREIAQISGLIFTGYPGSPKTGRQKQVSSSLLYQVFAKYEPTNLLLKQSRDEVLFSSLESQRMATTLQRMASLNVVWKDLTSPSPLAFPLVVERVASHLSNETLEKKVERLKKSWQQQEARA